MGGAALSLGPFDLLEPIGEGSASTVWRGVHRTLGAPVAIKVFAAGSVYDPDLRAAFRGEVRAVAGLDHPHIVRVYDYGDVPAGVERRSEGRIRARAPWLALEHAPGGSLSRWLGRLRWPTLRETLAVVLGALAHAHARGVVHRDLKPGNVLVGGVRPGLKLADFGIARRADDSEEACIVGTPSYMAPEQVTGEWRDQGPWTDLYALGCMGWALATGAAPFGRLASAKEAASVLATDPPAFRPRMRVPADFEAWLRWLLRKDAARRPRDAAEALEALQKLKGAMREGSAPESDADHAEAGRFLFAHAPEASAQEVGAGLRLFGLRPRPLVGRAVEEARLKAALARVRTGRVARMVVLKGPTGVGKSRLADWVCVRAAERGQATPLRAVHGPAEGASDGLAAMLARHFRCDGLDREGARARLARTLGDALDDLALDALAGDLAGGESTGVRFSGVRERHACYARVLARLAEGRPLVVWLDDVQWGDDALAFAGSVVGRDVAILFVATAREEVLATRREELARVRVLEARPEVEVVPVGPIAAEHRGALVAGLLQLEPGLAARVAARTQGNPLFAVNLLGDWVERRLLEPGPDGWRLAGGTADALPDDLYAMWSEMLAELLAKRPGDEAALELA
ncbi:MAG: protein kinase domain-containing protein, partial [Myxococcota bacterium]